MRKILSLAAVLVLAALAAQPAQAYRICLSTHSFCASLCERERTSCRNWCGSRPYGECGVDCDYDAAECGLECSDSWCFEAQ